MLDHELNAFGMRMGLPGLAFSPQGLVALDVSGMGRLYFEKQQPAWPGGVAGLSGPSLPPA